MGTKRVIKRKRIEGITHGRSGYARGCGCDVCLGDERSYQKWRKAVRNGTFEGTWDEFRKQDEMDNVTQLHVVPGNFSSPSPNPKRGNRIAAEPQPGPMEQAVIDECAGLSLATERPAMVMAARNAARIMDNPKQAALHTQANRQMVAILNDLRGSSKKKSGGRLAKVQAMTRKAQ